MPFCEMRGEIFVSSYFLLLIGWVVVRCDEALESSPCPPLRWLQANRTDRFTATRILLYSFKAYRSHVHGFNVNKSLKTFSTDKEEEQATIEVNSTDFFSHYFLPTVGKMFTLDTENLNYFNARSR